MPLSRTYQILAQLEEAHHYFSNTRYGHIVKEADRSFQRGELDLCQGHLQRLPTAPKLLAELIQKLKGKSVYKTLERSKRNRRKGLMELKALSSLLTHTVIECEHGRMEYRRLIPLLLEKLNDVGFNILKSEGDRR